MAARTKKNTAEKPAYPENLGVTGVLAFPLWNEDHLLKLKEWRSDKGLPKPKFPDRMGGHLFLTQKIVDKAQAYLLETFLPYALALNEYDGDKGFDKTVIDELTKKIEAEEWSLDDYVLPIRHLSEKDSENVDDDIVAKWVFGASGGNPMQARALVRDGNGALMATSLDDVENIPTRMEDTLWWGSRNVFRGAFNLNAYTAASTGISAYVNTLYLRSDLPMQWGGNDDMETILDDDFE